jgi:phage protein D
VSLLVVENTSGLYRCEATFGNWGTVDGRIGYLYLDRSTLDFGKRFAVRLSSGGPAAGALFDGRITAIEALYPAGGAPELTVLAEDRFQDLRMTRRTRTFEDLSDRDIIGQVAGEHGLGSSVELTGPKHKVVAQVNQSDLAFLRERARGIDGELWMEGDTLHAAPRSRRSGGSALSLQYGRDLREFTVLADLAGQRTSVAVSGWDPAGKQGLSYEATDSVLDAELGGTTSGARLLASALGQRKEALVHTVPLSSPEAQARAEAVFKLGARRFVTGRGVADADARLRVGSLVDLGKLGTMFDGKYTLTEVRHIFDSANGVRTQFAVERPGLGEARR